ncbi:hypothetical protein MJG53_004402 [Ovis ammon polii x Ovis aries]|uniref:Uncharacterized protein n=1 Tax=Ovis ammon polii x Ovis aries TaxID=2918886 RepID=A0ACB9VAT4_9CETA|nr:hypothetical protein MJG53_004402 [Ovis ammon polii x Ovis aries]
MWLYLAVLVVLYYLLRWYRERQVVSHLRDKFVFITGCDSGFGNQLARQLDLRGLKVLAGCLTEQGAEQLRNQTSDRLQTVILDVTKTESIAAATEWVKERVGDRGLWGLVNNAGIFHSHGYAEWVKIETYRDTLRVNLIGVIEVTLSMLPLVRRAQGRIVNVSSILGRIAFFGAVYCCSKYGVEAFSDILSSGSVCVFAPLKPQSRTQNLSKFSPESTYKRVAVRNVAFTEDFCGREARRVKRSQSWYQITGGWSQFLIHLAAREGQVSAMWLYLAVLVVLYYLLRWSRERQVVSHLQNKIIFITGYDSGFGNQLVRQLDLRGLRVLVACLTEQGAKQLRNQTSDRLQMVILDVTKTESIAAATKWVEEHVGDRDCQYFHGLIAKGKENLSPVANCMKPEPDCC